MVEKREGGKEIVKAFVSLSIISGKVETFYHKTKSIKIIIVLPIPPLALTLKHLSKLLN